MVRWGIEERGGREEERKEGGEREGVDGEGRERGGGRREEMRKGGEGVGSEQGGKREGVCEQQSAVIFMPSIYYRQHKKIHHTHMYATTVHS